MSVDSKSQPAPSWGVGQCLDDSVLVAMAKLGNLDAFNQLVVEYQSNVFNYVNWMVQNSQTAEDIVQETFLKVYQRIGQYRGGSFQGWLLQVAKNASLDELRKQKRRRTEALFPQTFDGDEVESPHWLAEEGSVQKDVETKELWRSMRSWINELHVKYSTAIVLVDLMTVDYADAAAIMGVPIGTVKSRVARGRMFLRSRLTSFQHEPLRSDHFN